MSLALIFRIGLLLGITWIIGFTKPFFSIMDFDVSGRDLILAIGGLFLIAKSTSEISHKMEGKATDLKQKKSVTFTGTIIQIIALDIIFSFDSILTAVGLTDQVAIMIVAVVIAIIIMMIFASSISSFIGKHPTLEILALSFLILIGFMLMVEALHYHVPKGYIYFAMGFSIFVEMLNLRARTASDPAPVQLRRRMAPSAPRPLK